MISKITPATVDFPELEWEQESLMYTEDKSIFWLMTAEKEGTKYTAVGEYCCRKLIDIRDIEEDPINKYANL
ncbi:MAG TPA: hypothetical protein VFF57_05340 [Hanamia sp.]|nr:hypothetical protein [Hanamia sp.]